MPAAPSPVLPDYAALTADGKLPDPFKKLDGTRITNKSEWRCRRAEIVKQLAKYIYGDKPIPPKGSVTGTVSTTSISVKVTEGTKTTSFTASVNMNGATMPAPAIISYGAGRRFPVALQGSPSPRSRRQAAAGQDGAVFHLLRQQPSGRLHGGSGLASQPHHRSLEQNPRYHRSLSHWRHRLFRNGKGAFAGGVFDNRIALTIPCESGIGGTPALRLKEQLDPGDNSTAEWPYHAISYVRWLSEVALGPFATANSASGDNTDRLPVDMHTAMAMIAPRAIYIVDNPGITNLDPKSAYVTAMAGKAIFEALGVGDHFAMQGASGTHCTGAASTTPR